MRHKQHVKKIHGYKLSPLAQLHKGTRRE